MPRMRPMKIVDLSLFAALLAAGCVEAAPEQIDETSEQEPAVRGSGERVELDGAAAIAPAPGTSVWSETLLADGTTRQFVLHTTRAGEVVFEELGDEAVAHGPGRASEEQALALDACADDAYTLHGWRWESAFRWSFYAESTPGELTQDAAESAIAAATAHIAASHNSCGLADEVRAAHEYLGRDDRAANIGAAAECLASDGDSVVSFGELPEGVLATTCVWFRGGVAQEGDVQLSRRAGVWTTRPAASACAGLWSLQAVMTHARGHGFGLAHVDERAHGELTMSPAINGPCQDAESTLGHGDVQGLRALYASAGL